MVAQSNFGDEYGQNPRTLGDWVKNFRLKRLQMKRKLRTSGGELRVCAILSTALMSAELELRRKQQERFQKWLEFQAKIKSNEIQTGSELRDQNNNTQDDEMILLARGGDDSDDAQRRKQSEEINNLWKCELSELDNFMRSISSSSNSNNNNNNSNNSCSRQNFNNPITSSVIQQQSIQVTS